MYIQQFLGKDGNHRHCREKGFWNLYTLEEHPTILEGKCLCEAREGPNVI
uniref:Uncharacterized protein n=1 Tax=Arundo donax TaxID=35708 RepID=A0A0A9FLM8_ARUDO